MALFVLFGVVFCSYVHHANDADVPDNKKVVCTAVIAAVLLIWIVLSAIFGGEPVQTVS